jgi:hypothetical protein
MKETRFYIRATTPNGTPLHDAQPYLTKEAAFEAATQRFPNVKMQRIWIEEVDGSHLVATFQFPPE